MSNAHTGGPAFPRPESPAGKFSDSRVPGAQEGMTLRDYFAAKAMQASRSRQSQFWDDLARESYEIADAMLRERAK
jgi:hypothetical protein